MNLTQVAHRSRHQLVFVLALAGLLILRIPFAGFVLLSVSWAEHWGWVDPVYQIGTYLLTTLLVWWERDHLVEYQIDLVAIVIIALFPPLQTLILRYWRFDRNLLQFPSIASLMIWLIAIVFLVAMWLNRSRLPKVQGASFAWLGIGMLMGLGTAMLLSYPRSLFVPAGEDFMGPLTLFSRSTLRDVGVKFVYQMGYAAVMEEPVFRGFLWGYLLKLGWHDRRIWVFQAALFTFAHISGLRWFPLQFWVIVPISSLILGYLLWRSRMLTSSLTAHGMVNATGDLFARLVAQYLR